MKSFGFLFFCLLFWLGPGSELHAFRCGNDLIQEGDLKIEVLRACGEPISIESWEEVKSIPIYRYGILWHTVAAVKVEEWVYNLGPNRFMRIVRFENGRVKKIEAGDYGY